MTTRGEHRSLVAARFGLLTPAARKTVAVLAGAALVALGAQLAVPFPGTPVPFTLQVPAVLIVGGVLGPRLGVASLVLYLVVGAGGAPVFAPFGPPGLARLLGPTGGYLLAFPLAAAVAGYLAGPARPWTRVARAMVVGLLTIHAGGLVQLAAMHGDLTPAIQLGSLPFLSGDLVKLVLATLVVRELGPRARALR